MDSNSLQPSQLDYSYPPGSINGPSNTMPPLAPPYKHWDQTAEEYNHSTSLSEQQTLNRLMDSVHEGRMEEIHIGRYTAEIQVNEAHIVNGSIEIKAQIIPKPAPDPDNSHYHTNSNPAPYNYQPTYLYSPQYSYQPQYPYQSQYQMPYPPPSQLQSQYPYQPQFQYPYLNPVVPPQYPLRFNYSQPAPYLYQYPLSNAAGSIANAISQLALSTNLLRR